MVPDCPPVPEAEPRLEDHEIGLAHRLYARYSGDLLSFFRATCRLSKADAFELVQQTFHELLETLARRDDLEILQPRAFLFKLGVCQLSAAHRRRQRGPAIDGAAQVTELPSDNQIDDLEFQASLRTEQRLVLRAMRRLTDRAPGVRRSMEDSSALASEVSELQLLVYFRFWVGLTLAEVAVIFGVTTGVVSGRQRRALERLRQEVETIQHQEGNKESTSTEVLFRWREQLEEEAGWGWEGWSGRSDPA